MELSDLGPGARAQAIAQGAKGKAGGPRKATRTYMCIQCCFAQVGPAGIACMVGGRLSDSPNAGCLGRVALFPSKGEAKAYAKLKTELKPGQRLYRSVRLPLWSLAVQTDGRVNYAEVDFVIVVEGVVVRILDRKGGWKNRETKRTYLAIEAAYGLPVEIV